MGKADAVLDLLPSIYDAGDRRKLIAEVVAALAVPLEAADADLFRIQRAHRIAVADHPLDILRLAAALDLKEFHFEDLLVARLAHEPRLAMMRERVRRVARLHLSGLGTPWAVIEAAAIFLGATVVADGPGEPLVRHLDREGYSHRATVEFGHAPDRPREQIILHENPYRRIKVDPEPRWPGDGWTVESRSVDVGPVRITIRGVGDRTVLPTVFCPELPGGVLFNGVVPDGATLVIDQRLGARLDGRDVSRWLISYEGGMYDYVDSDAAPFAVSHGERLEPYMGDGEADAPAFSRKPPLPRPPLGESRWHFTVAAGVYDGHDFDEAVFDPAPGPVGRFDEDPPLEECVYDLPPNGVVGMAWDERVACAFKLLIPHHAPAPGAAPDDGSPRSVPVGTTSAESGQPDLAGRIAAVLPRFRAAGITAFVETAADAWVVGRSTLRPLDAMEGEGVDFHSTRLVAPAAEILIPFDPSPR